MTAHNELVLYPLICISLWFAYIAYYSHSISLSLALSFSHTHTNNTNTHTHVRILFTCRLIRLFVCLRVCACLSRPNIHLYISMRLRYTLVCVYVRIIWIRVCFVWLVYKCFLLVKLSQIVRICVVKALTCSSIYR